MSATSSLFVEPFSVATDRIQLIVRGTFDDVELRPSAAAGVGPSSTTRLDLPIRTRLGRPTAPKGDLIAALDFTALSPATTYDVFVDGRVMATTTTLTRPPGPLVGRVATLSDLHIGQRRNGRLPRVPVLAETGPVDHHSGHAMACLRAAVDEINTWNPDLVLVKGDIAHTNAAEEYDLAFGELARLRAPLLVTAGNHDGGDYQGSSFVVEAARHGHRPEPIQIRDMGSWRIVLADTVIPGKRAGTLASTGESIIRTCGSWAGPCLIGLHHQLMPRRVPHYVPSGIPSTEAEPFLRGLAAANPRTLVTSGHTHRHRVRHVGSVIVTEVGSTKDYPGTWAGYELHADGVVQAVRRIADAEAVMWNERTRQAALGVWSWWAPGSLADRCFSHGW